MKKGFINILLYLFFPAILTSMFFSFLNINKFTYFIFISLPYFLLTFYYIYSYKKIFIEDIKKINKKNILITISIFILGFLLMLLANYIINYKIFDGTISINEANNRNLLFNNKLTYSILLCFLIPFLEEISFRLEFKKNIKSGIVYVLLSSFIFSLVHVVNLTSLLELIYLIPYFINGLTFSYIYQKTDCIYLNIIFHMIHNTISVITLLFFI